jgi:protein kinase-like protein
MRSSTSTDAAETSLPSGTEIAGFRVERVLGRGSAAVVYEATQLDLDRRVALKLLPLDLARAKVPQLRWLEHPNVVSLYAAGVAGGDGFLAMQLVHGPSLAHLRQQRRLGRASVADILRNVAAAIDAAHAEGTVHGSVTARNVLVDRDGRALLSDFGLGAQSATPADDRAAFAGLVSECLGGETPDPLPPSAAEILEAAAPSARGPKRPWPAVAVGAAALALAAALAAVFLNSRDDPEQAAPPIAGAQTLGSALAAGDVDSVDCVGREPTGASEPCTVAQTRLAAQLLTPRRGGVIRRWAVQGARGHLALQVLRRHGRAYFMVARSPYVSIPDGGLHVLPANLPIQPGDLVGLAVTPGAAVGVRRGTDGAAMVRWFGPLFLTVRPPEQPERSGFDHELLLRVEYVPGATWRPPGQLTGQAAAEAQAGRVLSTLTFDRSGAKLAAVLVGGTVALDLFDGRRRVARLPVGDADPHGRLVSLDTDLVRLGRQIIDLRWRNPDGILAHDYLADARSLTPLG